MPWWGVLSGIAGTFLGMNAIFAVGYLMTGGISGVSPGSFRDVFFFSVQTMGTIGYGAMYPVSTAAHALVVAESVVGLILTALATGIVFARFSQTTGQLIFSKQACISLMNGVPTLSFRIGNDRASTVFEAHVRVAVIRTEKTREGVIFYRLHDAVLTRDRSPVLARSWNVMHPIDEASPLFGITPESCVMHEIEIAVSVSARTTLRSSPCTHTTATWPRSSPGERALRTSCPRCPTAVSSSTSGASTTSRRPSRPPRRRYPVPRAG